MCIDGTAMGRLCAAEASESKKQENVQVTCRCGMPARVCGTVSEPERGRTMRTRAIPIHVVNLARTEQKGGEE